MKFERWGTAAECLGGDALSRIPTLQYLPPTYLVVVIPVPNALPVPPVPDVPQTIRKTWWLPMNLLHNIGNLLRINFWIFENHMGKGE